jgi:acetyltransferase-like isoleucine patch superfamily enzyme
MGYLKIQNWYKNHKAAVYTAMLRSDFGRIGKGTVIYPPFHSNNAKEVYIGEKCIVIGWGWIDAFCEHLGRKYDARIDIGDRTYIGHRSHINACSHMKIGNDVVIADEVFISDLSHGYEDINKPVFGTPLVSPGPVVIEDEVWLGERVCVLPNVTIGKHSVIGCNAVVTRDIPAYSVAAGTPARVIRQYNQKTGKWEKV